MLAFETSQWPMLTVLQRYTYYSQEIDSLIYICDDARYLNHSDTPNSAPSSDRLASVTIRDVEKGEELLENYSTYDFCPWANLWGDLGRQLGAWKSS